MQAGIGGVRHLSRLWSPTPCLCCFRIGRHQFVQTDGEERVPVEVAKVQHFPDFPHNPGEAWEVALAEGCWRRSG